MSAKRKYIVLVLLLVMLAASIANFIFVNRAYDTSMQRLSASSLQDNDRAAVPAHPVAGVAGKPGTSADMQIVSYKGPGWRGDVTLKEVDGGSYLITVRASDLNDNTVPITSFEIDVRRPDSDKPMLMPVFNQTGDGHFTATVQFPGTGDWEVRVRMHRDLQTLEFARRFHIK